MVGGDAQRRDSANRETPLPFPSVLPVDDAFWARSGPRDARSALVETLRYELLGPAEPEEKIEASPLTRYLVGMLAPFGTLVAPEEADELGAGDEGEDEVDGPR